jgi:hypothetical protein
MSFRFQESLLQLETKKPERLATETLNQRPVYFRHQCGFEAMMAQAISARIL